MRASESKLILNKHKNSETIRGIIDKSILQKVHSNHLEKLIDDWKSFGAVSTPKEIVELMIELTGFKNWQNLKILEPACGFCNFLINIYSKFPKNMFYGIEFNKKIYDKIKKLFVHNSFKLIKGNFLLWNTTDKFDLIIGNPPYGIMGYSTHYAIPVSPQLKTIYKTIFKTWYGKYNIYATFIEKSVNLLKKKGKLVFIIPTTFMILDEFTKLRRFLALQGKITIYYLGSGVFKTVSVSTVILKLEKDKKGLELWDFSNSNRKLVVKRKNYNGQLICFKNNMTKNIEKNSFLLGDLFKINIAARSPEIKKFPFVSTKKRLGYLPILKGTNLKVNKILYNEKFSGYWIRKDKITSLRHYYNKKRIVIGHTKGGKIVAAIDHKRYPWMGDVYQLTPKEPNQFAPKLTFEYIVSVLNSNLMNKYVSTLYKNITPHTTTTQLKLLPLHKKSRWTKLEEKYGKDKQS